MRAISAIFRVLAVLVTLWSGLAIAGLVMGVVPLDGRPPGAVAEAGTETTVDAAQDGATDGGEAGGDGATADSPTESEGAREPEGEQHAEGTATAAAVDPETEAVAAETEDPEDAPAESGPSVTTIVDVEVTRQKVCDESGAEPSLAVGDLFGDAHLELVIGCAGHWEVIGLGPNQLLRVARIEAPPPLSGQRARLGAAAIGDIDADERSDLVLPLSYLTQTGASRGGVLAWVGRYPAGGIREPATLATIAAHDVRLTEIDAQPGLDLVALNRANVLAQLPSELWAFRGSAAPERTAAVAAGTGGSDLEVADVDRDGFADLLVVSEGALDIFFGDGEGAFPRNHHMDIAGAREVAVGDLDGDGGTDFAVLGDGLSWFRAGPLEAMEPHAVDGVPSGLREVVIRDVTGDDKADFVGWDHPRLVVLRHRGELSFEARPGIELAPSAFAARRHRLLDLDLDGDTDDLVVLGTSGEGGPLELLLLPDATVAATVTPSAEAEPVRDAPLVLTTTVPR